MSISALLPQLIIPLNLGVALLLVATLLFIFRARKTALCLSVAAAIWVGAWSLPATSIWTGGYLEQLYPYVEADASPTAEAIVVLGGNTANNRKNWFEPVETSGTRSRTERAAELYAMNKAPQIVVSGAALDGGYSEAQMMARTLESLGVPESAIVLENESLTTRQNALFSVQQLRDSGITHVLLVTSALHMPRSIATFAKQGVEIIAAPVAPQIVPSRQAGFSAWRPSMRALQASRSIIKEYVGLIVYWTRGWV
ncbi:YdcF family protein [Paenalcaligenes niemegkensis]|uniref:YdcF family protein n=1 Tax=Paenalcaligenes niemegkensis TaxID=2895469 RepID=UPI001EE8762A|nr:YdcF family protein [Paenalcaligenes niemegkensis]MCQ9615616.1 YdcF family protein [Paenalcaligenes niemegkensis]